MESKSAFWEKVEALIKKNTEAKVDEYNSYKKTYSYQQENSDHTSDVFEYFFSSMSGASGGGRSRVKPPSFCKPGIKIDHKPLLQKKSSFDNTYGHSRLRSEDGTFYLNIPEGNIAQCFDVQDAILV